MKIKLRSASCIHPPPELNVKSIMAFRETRFGSVSFSLPRKNDREPRISAPYHSSLSLPNQLQRELNLPHGNLRRGEYAKARRRGSRGAKRFEIAGGWRREVRAIQHVEKLSPELHVEGFGDFLYVGILDHGEVEVEQARSNDGVASEVAHEIDARERIQRRRSRIVRGVVYKETFIAAERRRCVKEGRTGRDRVGIAIRVDVLQASVSSARGIG